MLYVVSNSYNPYYYLACEEYFLKNSIHDILMLWRAEPSVIVGKHQNALAEINLPYVLKNKIKIARRLSGGGTVVHDLQNINFTFITNGEPGKLIDFKKYISPIIEYLQVLGINATLGNKNEILIEDLKISGNAEHIFKNRVLHHGTLLFNSDMEQLKNAIKIEHGKYFDNSVQSNRAAVTNICNYFEEKISIEDFISGLSAYILNRFNNSTTRFVEPEENIEINKLVNEKYSTIEWIYGYSPKYLFKRKFSFNNATWIIEVEVEKGIIVRAIVFINGKQQVHLTNTLLGISHLPETIGEVLKPKFSGLTTQKLQLLIHHFF